MQGKKHSKVGHLASIFDAAVADFYQKHLRKADCQQPPEQAQQAFDSWRHCYNHERPHEALGLDTPSQHYRSSPREFPEHLAPIEYPPGDLVRKTDTNGHISLLGRQVRIGKGLVGQTVACRPVPSEDGVYEVYFCFYRLGRIDLNDFC